MLNNSKILAVIPAREGSKRIPFKNIKLFCGSPIISYSINAAREAHCFDEIMVSTDSKKIAKIAKSFGAKIPFYRSKINSNDFAAVGDVIIEVLKEYKKIGREFDYVACIYATAPLIKAQNLCKAIKILKEGNSDSIITITRFSYPIQRALKVDKEKVVMFWPENYPLRSQDLEDSFHDSGQFWCMKVSSLLKKQIVLTENTSYLEIPEFETQDIDNESDWNIAEFKYNIITNKFYKYGKN